MARKPAILLEIERALEVTFTTTRQLGEAEAQHASFDRSRMYDLIEVLETKSVLWHGQGQTVFIGLGRRDSGHGLFALPVADPIALMSAFEVGSHEDARGTRPEKARAGMQKILRAAAFIPYFADQAGFKVKFLGPVSAALAKTMESTVLAFDVEALSLVPDDFGGSLARSIRETGRLELWWD